MLCRALVNSYYIGIRFARVYMPIFCISRAFYTVRTHIYIESGCIKSECDMFWVECRNKHGYNCSWFVYIHQSVGPVLAHKRAYATGQAHSIKTTHFNGRARAHPLASKAMTHQNAISELDWKPLFQLQSNFFVQFNLKSFVFFAVVVVVVVVIRRLALWFGVSLSQFNLLRICLWRIFFSSSSLFCTSFLVLCAFFRVSFSRFRGLWVCM